MLRVREGGERIPITIADYDRAAGTITIVVQEVGATTTRVCALEVGDEILDVAGPLGGKIEIAPGGHVCGVGGGFGSAGFKGFVTQRLAQMIAGDGPGRPDHVVAIGPMAMMRAVAETTRGPKVKTLVSMDPLMVDGTGMCGGCRVNVGGKAQFACVDGPCFDAHEVDFDVAMRRNKAYVKEEKQALDRLTCMANREAR